LGSTICFDPGVAVIGLGGGSGSAFGAISAANFTQALHELLSLSPDGEFISYCQVPWVEFRSDQKMPLNLDGEPASLDSPRFEAVTGALRLVVPANCALVRAAAQADG